MSSPHEIAVSGKKLKLSNLDKVLYPASGFTKANVIDYYRRIAPVILPHLKQRPVTLKRYPDGVEGKSFYEKNCPAHRPDWVKTAPVWSEGNQREMQYCLVGDVATLLWTANLAALELHTSLARAQKIDCPTMVVFDLDPGLPADVLDCGQVALWLREMLEHWDLESFVKTSGKKGLQLYVPLNTATSYEETKTFAYAVARLLEERHPDRILSQMKKDLRGGKVFVDWSQNDQHKTTVAVYSMRAEPEPRVSTPIAWEELEKALAKKKPAMLQFNADEVLKRVTESGDLFAPVLKLKQKLPTASSASKSRSKSRESTSKKADSGRSHLKEYAAKRDFQVTPEPAPKATASKVAEHPTYMIHEHHASHLHYDLRLEMDGALASWAIPKGPSLDPKVKRLAVRTEDHPLEYGQFEGEIPKGQYGAGEAIIWDKGFYDTLPPGQASQQRKKGHLDLVFAGEELNGHFHLVRTKMSDGGKEQWIFFKAKDPVATASSPAQAQSSPEALLRRFFPPMLATLCEALPAPESDWLLEMKYDGYRAIAALAGGKLAMWTRNRLDLTQRFPAVASALGKLNVAEAVLDGEIVALDARGAPRFQRMGEGKEELFVFDLLWLDGRDLRTEPIETRRELLEKLLHEAPRTIHVSERVTGDWKSQLHKAGKRGYEGLVAKKNGSTYENRRSRSWLKLKVLGEQELAIVGYTPQTGNKSELGALLLGYAQNGDLVYAGKVGTGFSNKVRASLLHELSKDVVDAPRVKEAPRMREAIWVKPRLVAQVRFTEWTEDNKLRHPAFLGLRVDKKPGECVRE